METDNGNVSSSSSSSSAANSDQDEDKAVIKAYRKRRCLQQYRKNTGGESNNNSIVPPLPTQGGWGRLHQMLCSTHHQFCTPNTHLKHCICSCLVILLFYSNALVHIFSTVGIQCVYQDCLLQLLLLCLFAYLSRSFDAGTVQTLLLRPLALIWMYHRPACKRSKKHVNAPAFGQQLKY